MEISTNLLLSITLAIMFSLVIMCFYGINILNITGGYLQQLSEKISSFTGNGKNELGKGINYISNSLANSAKIGIDITNSAVNDVGDLVQNKPLPTKNAESFVNISPYKESEPEPSPSELSLQKPISSMNSSSWSTIV